MTAGTHVAGSNVWSRRVLRSTTAVLVALPVALLTAQQPPLPPPAPDSVLGEVLEIVLEATNELPPPTNVTVTLSTNVTDRTPASEPGGTDAVLTLGRDQSIYVGRGTLLFRGIPLDPPAEYEWRDGKQVPKGGARIIRVSLGNDGLSFGCSRPPAPPGAIPDEWHLRFEEGFPERFRRPSVLDELEDNPPVRIKVEGPEPSLPGAGNKPNDAGADQDPVQGPIGQNGSAELPGWRVQALAAGSKDEPFKYLPTMASTIVEMRVDPIYTASVLEPPVGGAAPFRVLVGGTTAYFSLDYPLEKRLDVTNQLALVMKDPLAYSPNATVVGFEENFCREKQPGPNDPYFLSRSSWKQSYDDQWAIKRVGFTAERDSAWSRLDQTKGSPVVVAVIDSGLDWNHQDLSWDNIWVNADEVPDNGIDDDKNGYVDDVIGWDFVRKTNKPWDGDGHGTFVAGVIAAARDNGIGIAGINPHARIMVLKALDSFGQTRASFLAEAIVYAADNGARVINISAGGYNLTRAEQAAVDYAHAKGAVVVAAAGNQGIDVAGFAPAGLQHVVAVAATDVNDGRAGFSNRGAGVDLAAPGVDIISLRARRTDLLRDIPGTKYEPGSAYVGADKRYYRAGGTSFSAPIVAATASLILSMRPELTNDAVERMLLQSAKDLDVPGIDQHTGYGLLDARAALVADPKFFVDAAVDGVDVVSRDGRTFVRVRGTADADAFAKAWVEIGIGEQPSGWKKVADLGRPVRGGALAEIESGQFSGAKVWMLRVITEHRSGRRREARFTLTLG